ncbi:metallophosphoesterase family protein [Candidatus Micrarchaeota archaeon]|nr:metallophosphoesterase family protein [Candidatus Micrarchaeota archaeon]
MKFIVGKPALIFNDNLVISDLHIGNNTGLSDNHLNNIFYENLADEIKNIFNSYNCKRLIILGDVKENITSLPLIVNRFFERLSLDNITIVKGNHDGNIERLCRDFGYDLCPSTGCVIGNVGLVHGHCWPDKEIMKQDYVIMGHIHPSLVFTDKFNKSYNTPVWVKCGNGGVNIIKFKEYVINPNLKLVISPAYNPLLGYNLNKKSLDLSPILKNNVFKLNLCYIYNLNGGLLGRLTDFLEG